TISLVGRFPIRVCCGCFCISPSLTQPLMLLMREPQSEYGRLAELRERWDLFSREFLKHKRLGCQSDLQTKAGLFTASHWRTFTLKAGARRAG
ncbi:hypothetical protein AMELA_G00192660, partial [Ameiurus melas]